MPEKEDVFSSKIKFDGLLNFAEFYKFCYDWLSEEKGFDLSEAAYKEKIKGDSKDIDIEWGGSSKATDYFQFKIKVEFKVIGLKEVEIVKEGAKMKMNKGSVEVKIKGTLVRDYNGKFETTATKKFMRSVYEKWIIPSRIDQYEGKLVGMCDEFLSQAKSFLDLTGKR